MAEPIRNIVVLGGGTAGWLSAAYLQRWLALNGIADATVTLIESEDIGIIGVGEATLPDIKKALRFIGVDEKNFLAQTNGSFKNAIKFVNWLHDPAEKGQHHYFHPFDKPALLRGFPIWDVWMRARESLGYSEDYAYMSGYAPLLCNNLRIPKTPEMKDFDGLFDYAYHMDAVLFGQFLRELSISRGARHVVDNVVGVEQDERGFVTSLQTKEHGSIEGDLFIDCSGFGGYLINKVMNSGFVGFSDNLFCDRAVAMRVPFPSRPGEIRPFTTSTAQSSGWIWEIHLSGREDPDALGRRGIGYVYSSNFISDEDAERELRAYIGPPSDGIDARFLKMRVGRCEEPWIKNVVAVGLSGGFIEPLESTGISLIFFALDMLRFHFPNTEFPDALRGSYNDAMARVYDQIREFIVMHYCTTQREDSEFWRANKHNDKIPGRLKQMLETWRYRPPEEYDDISGFEFFTSFSYRYILGGMQHLTEPSSLCGTQLSEKDVRAYLSKREEDQQKVLAETIDHRQFLSQLPKSKHN